MSAHILWNSHRFFKCGYSSTNKRKVSLACVIILVLFLQETNCQDKHSESTPSPDAQVYRSPTAIPIYPCLYSCCQIHFLQNESTTEYPNGTEVSTCKLFDTQTENSSQLQISSATVEIATRNFTVKLKSREMCPKPEVRIFLPMNETGLDRERNKTLRKRESDKMLLDNGYLKINFDYFAPDEFCVDKITENQVELLVCPTDCKKRVCVKKCCGLHKLMSLRVDQQGPMGCELPNVPGKDFHPPVYHDYSTKVSKIEEEKMPMPHYIQTPVSSFRSNCYDGLTNLLTHSEELAQKISDHTQKLPVKYLLRLRKDGTMLYRHVNGECMTQPDNFCADGFQFYGDSSTSPFMNSEDEFVIVSCAEKRSTPGGDTISTVLGPLMLAVSIFPFLTTLVYVLLWKKQTVHGWTIVSTSTSVLFMYIFIGTSHILRQYYGQSAHDTKGCVFVAVASHFFFLSTFTWLTVMCCDLWWTFRTLAPRNRKSKGLKRFINYALFGWGIPSLIITVSLIIHYMEDNCNDYLIVPAYGRESCYLTGRAMGVYLHYPGAALLLVNVIFFSVTCFKLYQYRTSCQMASKTDMKECFSRFGKLFFVMGVTWIFEIISWFVDGFGWIWYWAIFDVINILRAAAVFVIYVCKRDILTSLEESYPQLKKFVRPATEQPMNSLGISKDGATTITLAMPSTSLSPSKSDSDFTQL